MKITICIITALGLILLGGIFWIEFQNRSDRIAAELQFRLQAEAEAKAQAQRQREISDEKARQELPVLLKSINDGERVGLIDSNRANYLRDMATGKLKLYKMADGTITTNPFSK